MYITIELLKRYEACNPEIKWFEKNFPNGATTDELIQNIQDKAIETPTGFIWWFYENIQQDKRLYQLCGIDASDGVNRSNGVNVSNGVNWSDGVNISNGVNESNVVSWSDGVNESNGVNWSNGVNESNGVSGSDGVNTSCGVNLSFGMNMSDGVNESNGVNWSNGVNRSDGVNGSNGVNESNGVNGSFGILNSNGVDNALFLSNKMKTYSIFGKDVTKDRFNEVFSILSAHLKGWQPIFFNIKSLYLKSGFDWKLTPISSAEEIQKEEAWRDMPQSAIDYISSIPEFDSNMFYEITGKQIKVKQKENGTNGKWHKWKMRLRIFRRNGMN